MLFPTISFALFFLATSLLYWSAAALGQRGQRGQRGRGGQRRKALANLLRKCILLLASYIFYGIWDWRLLPLLVLATLANFLFANWLLVVQRSTANAPNATMSSQRRRSLAKAVLGLAIAVNLGALVFFKYTNWLLANLNTLLHSWQLPLLFPQVTIILPLGISFFTFQNVSFLLDIYRQKLRRSGSLLDYSLYIAFFPQLIAGPIVRARAILPQLQRLPSLQNIYFSDALSRILLGLAKKLLIANTLSTNFVDAIFLAPSAHSSTELLLAAYAYSAIIYCDFSAYSDMAVGLGLLCGIRLMENFDRPYARTSLQDFWRGWHISLSTWLRDYLYIPLGGSRKGNRYVHITLTMLLGGLWHGAAWTFLAWGALHGLAISTEHFLRRHRSPSPEAPQNTAPPGIVHAGSLQNTRELQAGPSLLRSVAGWLYTFHFVTLSWILFRAPNFEIAGSYFVQLFRLDLRGGESINNMLLLSIALGILPQILLPKLAAVLAKLLDTLPIAAQIAAFSAAIALLQVVIPDGVAPFIYYQF